MRILSLLQFSAVMIAFGIYFYFIEPFLSKNILLRLFIFSLVFLTLSYLVRWPDGRFEFLEKRIDKQLSVWIVFFIIFILLFLGTLN